MINYQKDYQRIRMMNNMHIPLVHDDIVPDKIEKVSDYQKVHKHSHNVGIPIERIVKGGVYHNMILINYKRVKSKKGFQELVLTFYSIDGSSYIKEWIQGDSIRNSCKLCYESLFNHVQVPFHMKLNSSDFRNQTVFNDKIGALLQYVQESLIVTVKLEDTDNIDYRNISIIDSKRRC